MTYVAFDLEIAEPMQAEYDGQHISCAAIFTDRGVKCFQNHPYMTRADAEIFVSELLALVLKGYSLLTWNGLSFDFKVLAVQTGLFDICRSMAFDHYDLMFQVLCIKGFTLRLDKALIGAGLAGKKHSVQLKSGEMLNGMSGKSAPELWQKGETDAVLSYLHDDVEQLYRLAYHIEKNKVINWIANSGRQMSLSIPEILTVRDCLDIPLPDNSWMTTRVTRESMFEWTTKEHT